MSTTLKNASQQVLSKTIQPTRTFFRVSENIPSIQHARAVFKTLGTYGDMVEYKVMRVSMQTIEARASKRSFVLTFHFFHIFCSAPKRLNIFVMDLLYIKTRKTLIRR